MDPQFRTTPVAKYVRRSGVAMFAPLVKLADWMLDRWAPSDAAHVLGASPGPGWIPLRPDIRKVLAFDDKTRGLIWIAILCLYPAPVGIQGIVEFVRQGHWNALARGIFASSLTVLGWIACVFYVASRVRELRSLFARCVVVTAQFTSAVPYATPKSMMVKMSLVYVCSGIRYETDLKLTTSQSGLVGVGSMTQIIVNPQCLSQIFLRDFYT